MNNLYDLIIIGYGAAGMMAAAQAKDLKTLVLEKNPQAGRKVLISGKGQCNFTHEETLQNFVEHFGSHKNFVKHALGKMTPPQTRKWFSDRGIESIVMENGKVFPKSLCAGDLVEVLVNEALNNGVELRFKEAAEAVKITEEQRFEVRTEKGSYRALNLLITTGGFTYAVTGSDGDGYKLAKSLGHTVVAPRPALTPIYHGEAVLKELAGVSIADAKLGLVRENKQIASYSGDLLFTHKGLSGPVILNNSRDFIVGDSLRLAFVPLTSEVLNKELIEMADKKGKTFVRAYLRQICYSKSLADQLALILNLDENLTFSQVNKVMRQQIVLKLTAFDVPIEQIGGRQIGMVTAGGVSLDEVKAKNLASKVVEGLYFAGEVLDIDGDTGGYNIQWAFSSAGSAVNDIVTKMKSKE